MNEWRPFFHKEKQEEGRLRRVGGLLPTPRPVAEGWSPPAPGRQPGRVGRLNPGHVQRPLRDDWCRCRRALHALRGGRAGGARSRRRPLGELGLFSRRQPHSLVPWEGGGTALTRRRRRREAAEASPRRGRGIGGEAEGEPRAATAAARPRPAPPQRCCARQVGGRARRSGGGSLR